MTTMNSTKLLLFSTSLLGALYFALFAGFNLSLNLVHGEPLEGGNNVCTISIPFKKDIKVIKPVSYEFKVQSMCGLLPCTKTRTETKQDESIKTIIQYAERRTCCLGYTETPENKCVPICLKSCNNGKCVSPNVCKCHQEPTLTSPGFVGPTCGRFSCLDSNKWGSKCDKECNCSQPNSYCSANTGQCLCYPGWRGENCNLACDSSSSNETQCDYYLTLPPLIEPEANVMDDSGSVRSAKMMQPDALVRDGDANEANNYTGNSFWIATTLLSIICWASLVIYLLVVKRTKEIRDDPYYESCSGGGSGHYSVSNYAPTTTTTHSGGDFFNKNLSMTASIRNTLQGFNTGKNEQVETNRSRPILAPKIEAHLIDSQRESQKNVYSEPLPNIMHQDCRLYASPANLSINSNLEHIYQVPRSQANKTSIGQSSPGYAQCQQLKQNDNMMTSISEQHDNISDDGVSNIYEELKPRAPEPR